MVDDDSVKHHKLGALIKKSSLLNERVQIDTALDLSTARVRLREEFYDYLILDLNISESMGDELVATAGSDFIEEIIETDGIKKPNNIVILSSNDEAKTQFKSDFRKGFEILNFDPTDSEWEDSLISKFEYSMVSKDQRNIKDSTFDVCIVTAVDIEMNQLKGLWSEWRLLEQPNDSTQYYCNSFLDKDGIDRSVLIAQQSEMGMSASTYLSTKLIYQFKPRYLIMVGIAASTKDDYNFGDIIVPDEVWNYSSGKFIRSEENTLKFLPDSKSIQLDTRIKNTIYQGDFVNDLTAIKREFHGNKPDTELKIAKGPMACGSAVVAEFSVVKDWVLGHSRKNVGLDMESYGVFYAASNSFISHTTPICIKSISDFANERKGDEYQNYSAYTSAAFAKKIIETKLIFKDHN